MVDGVDLHALLDERAISLLIADYGAFIDYGEKEAWLSLFAPDARYVLRYRQGLTPRSIGKPVREDGDLVYAGRAALQGFIAAHGHRPIAGTSMSRPGCGSASPATRRHPTATSSASTRRTGGRRSSRPDAISTASAATHRSLAFY